MKSRFNFSILVMILIVAMFSLVQSATSYDETVTKYDVPGVLVYKGTITISDSAANDTYYTQAFMIGGVSSAYGYGYFYCAEAGTEDVNVFIEYSNDLITWTAGTTDSDLDAVGTTVVGDTLGIAQGSDYYLYRTKIYARLKVVVGQNMNSTTFYYDMGWKKPAGSERANLGATANRKTS